MNVLFHTTTAIGIAVLLTDTNAIEKLNSSKKVISTGIFAFAVGVISHGALDYIPHCYPINSKVDAIASLIIILAAILVSNKKYRLIMALSFLGSLIPDIIDLSPGILNKLFDLKIPTVCNIFPWHYQQYSGSIYTDDCSISKLNHLLLILTIVVICWCRKTDFKILFGKNS